MLLNTNYKWWIFIAVGIFGISFGIGLALTLAMPATIANLFSEELAALGELSVMLSPFKVTTAIFIFLKNTSALLLSFIFSPILCLLPILALTVNGLLLSFISTIVAQKESLGFVLAGLLPHGIFELPALIIGEAAALSFGAMVIVLLLRKESRTVLVSTVKQSAGHILLALTLSLTVGIFHAIIVIALFKEETRIPLMANLKRNLRYLVIAFALLVPAAIIETYITPLLLD